MNDKCCNYRLPAIQESLARMWDLLLGDSERYSFWHMKKVSDSVGLARIDDNVPIDRGPRFYLISLADGLKVTI